MSYPIIGALIAALLFAGANNFQRRAAGADRHADAGPFRLMLRLLVTPRWLIGQLLATAGLFFHARALTQGGVILVQSVIATTLVYAILIEAAVEHRRLRPQELIGSLTVVVGVALLVGVGRPNATGEFRSLGRAVLVLLVSAAIAAGALWVSRRRPRGRRTALILGAAAGASFALDAVFLRAAAGALSPLDQPVLVVNGLGFAVASVFGNIIVSRGYQSAPLRHVLPGLAAAEPVTALVFGSLVFGETFAAGWVAATGAVLGLALMLVGVVLGALGSAYQRESIPG